MKGPLQTVIRNLTDKLLTYNVSPRLFVQPHGEFLLSFDPFTRWGSHPDLERMLMDVRQGRAMITYLYDPDFCVTAPFQNVQLSMNAMRILGADQNEVKVETVKKIDTVRTEPQKRPQLEGVQSPGELPPEPEYKKPPLDKTAHAEERLSRHVAEAAGITDYPEDAAAGKTIDKMLDERSLTPQPDKAVDIEKQAAAKKVGRKKKEVVTI